MVLKTTYKPASVPAPSDSLPPGWTEHRAPSGHLYYYNADTKQSTYTRPVLPSPTPASEDLLIDYGATNPDPVMQASLRAMDEFHKNNTSTPHFTGGRSYQDRSRRENRQGDRPKTKKPIPNCDPWLVVYTKYGRRFVHNTDTKESLWKFPSDVILALIDMDRIEHEEKQSKAAVANEQSSQLPTRTNSDKPDHPSTSDKPNHENDFDSDEYEEVEVTDDEAEADEHATKRPRTEDPPIDEQQPQGPLEFDEADIAYQLAALEEDTAYDDAYDDPDMDYADDDDEEGLPMTAEDAQALFRSLLDDHSVNIFSTFDALLETTTPLSTAIISDDRWLALTNMASRRAAFDAWSRDRVAERNAVATEQVNTGTQNKKLDPIVTYLTFLSNEASTKLYYPEFKRKFRKDAAQNDKHLAEKDREKLYRDYVARLKKPEGDRKKDLVSLLKSLPLSTQWNRSIDLAAQGLPAKLEKDPRYWAVRDEKTRLDLLDAFVATLPESS